MPTRTQVTMGLLAMPLALSACGSREAIADGETMSVSDGVWTSVAAKRIIFAHQSVGMNILSGIETLAGESGKSLNIAETRTPLANVPGLYHFMVGENEDPMGKIRDFERTLRDHSLPDFDVAALKLCFVDFKADSDAEGIARAYLRAYEHLEGARPSSRFVAITSPMMTVPADAKEWLKRMLGRPSPAEAENAKRHAFNEVLRREVPADRLFDLARLENGGVASETEELRADLTDDGGHLNGQGQRLAGQAFLQVLAG